MTENITILIFAIVLFTAAGIGLGIAISRAVMPTHLPVYIDKTEYVYKTRTVAVEYEPEYEEFELPDGNHKFKSYLSTDFIRNHNSLQWAYKLLAEPDENGLLMIDDCYCVAMGSFYGALGSEYRVTLESGLVFNVIVTERKSDEHTDALHQYTVRDGSIIEFIVDMGILEGEARSCGDISVLGFRGNIVKLEYRLTPRE